MTLLDIRFDFSSKKKLTNDRNLCVEMINFPYFFNHRNILKFRHS